MESITSTDGTLIAIVAKADFAENGVKFLSKENYPLQLGISCYKRGDKIKPHIHLQKNLIINEIQEVVHFEKGKATVCLYDLNGKLFRSLELSMGDTIFFIEGGHGLIITEDTKLIEVKQGPYLGKEKDKLMIE